MGKPVIGYVSYELPFSRPPDGLGGAGQGGGREHGRYFTVFWHCMSVPIETMLTPVYQYDPCYHQLCDDVGNVNVTAWELNTKVSLPYLSTAAINLYANSEQLVAHSVATFAASFEGFPKRTTAASADIYDKVTKYHGHKLAM